MIPKHNICWSSNIFYNEMVTISLKISRFFMYPEFPEISQILVLYFVKISISGHWKKTEQKIFVTDKRFQVKMDDRNVLIDFVKLGFQLND